MLRSLFAINSFKDKDKYLQSILHDFDDLLNP